MTAAEAPAVIRALLVGDSPAQRAELGRVLQRDGDIAVVAEAGTAADAVELAAAVHPHVVVLDLQLGDNGGQHVIEQIMARTPTPILALLARVDDRRSAAAVEALVAGALEALPTPTRWTARLETELRHSVRQIRQVPVIRHPRGALTRPARSRAGGAGGEQPVVALAASTGGPSALAAILSQLHGLAAPVLVVQNLHPDFASGLARWMSRASALPVEMAEHGRAASPGRVYLAPPGTHLRLGANRRLELAAAPVTIHRPSADQLFGSLAERAGHAGVGVLLTGMGEDGARGLLEMRTEGGRTFAQDEASCAVFGMPRAALRLGAVAEADLVPLDELAAAVRRAVSGVGR